MSKINLTIYVTHKMMKLSNNFILLDKPFKSAQMIKIFLQYKILLRMKKLINWLNLDQNHISANYKLKNINIIHQQNYYKIIYFQTRFQYIIKIK